MIDRVSASVIRIVGDNPDGTKYLCSGVVVAKFSILTAAHCTVGTNLETDGHAALLLARNKYYDLALLYDPLTLKRALPISQYPPERFETIYSLGYGWGSRRLFVLRGTVFLINNRPDDDAPPVMYIQDDAVHGMSGGPVVARNGQLVSLVQQGGENIALGVGPMIIRIFLLGEGLDL